MSNFSFSHIVIKRLVMQTRKNQGLFGKGLTLSQTTNFRLFQTERACRRQFKIWWKWQRVIHMDGKHWEKEKLLITSNFFFSHSVFRRLVLWTCKNQGLFGKGLTCVFIIMCSKASESFVGKWEKMHLFIFGQCFVSSQREIPSFWIQLICHLSLILTLSQISPCFYVSAVKSFENTVEKGEIARNEQFLFFPQCILTDWKTFRHFHQ